MANQTAEARSVIVLAAGQGTRMKSALPKVLHPLLGRTLLGHAIEAAKGIDPEHLVVVVRHKREAVAAEAKRCCPQAIIADQDEIPGTGRAVFCALQGASAQGAPLRGTVLVTSGDVPLLSTQTLLELERAHAAAKAAVTVVTTIASDPTGYGRIIRDDQGQLTAIVEHRDASETERQIREINAGIYAFDVDFLASALAGLEQDNDQGELYLTDTVQAACRAGKVAQAFVLQDSWQAEGCNDRAQLATLRAELNRRVCHAHQVAGVSILDPQTTSVDVTVKIGQDAVIYPGTQLEGDTVVEAGAQVGPGSTIRNAVIGQGAIAPHCWIDSVSIASGESLEAFTVVNGGSNGGGNRGSHR